MTAAQHFQRHRYYEELSKYISEIRWAKKLSLSPNENERPIECPRCKQIHLSTNQLLGKDRERSGVSWLCTGLSKALLEISHWFSVVTSTEVTRTLKVKFPEAVFISSLASVLYHVLECNKAQLEWALFPEMCPTGI